MITGAVGAEGAGVVGDKEGAPVVGDPLVGAPVVGAPVVGALARGACCDVCLPDWVN